MNSTGLKLVSFKYVMDTTKFIRLAIRRKKRLISRDHWNEEQEHYFELLKGYVADFSREDNFNMSKVQGSEQTMKKYLHCLLAEIQEFQKTWNEENVSYSIEKLELTLALIYAVLTCFLPKDKILLHHFIMTTEEMGWVLEAYLSEQKIA